MGSSCRERRVAVAGMGVEDVVRVGDAEGMAVGESVRVGMKVAVGVEVAMAVEVKGGTAVLVAAAVTVGVMDASPLTAITAFGSLRPRYLKSHR